MSKYNSKKTYYDGIAFDSKKEAKRYIALSIAQESGLIRELELQPKYELIPKQTKEIETGEYYKAGKKKGLPKVKTKVIEQACTYKADFKYYDCVNHKYVVEDVKGMRTKEYKIKKKLMLYRYGIEIQEV